MPICPRCNATIHAGAEDQCPVCGYSLERANRIFGTRDVEFTRVLDEAGALTHQDRQDLLRTLEDLERNIPPVALCIYITARGQVQEFRTLAHWMLNHAHIHHPSFGRRERRQAIEDAELTERRQSENGDPTPRAPKQESWWSRLRKALRDALHPYPPPVRREWMLMLVLDVQLETACFTWGYMLDPYINPDSINSCILGARLQFRERAMAVGLKKVMRAAVSRLAVQSHRVNRKLRRSAQAVAFAAVCGLGLLAPAALAAPTPDSPWADDEIAEEVEEDTPAPPPAPAPAAAPKSPGAAAAYDHAPRWAESDYRHLLSGELTGGYRMLAPARSVAPAAFPEKPAQARSPHKQPPESDAKIPAQYYRSYALATDSGLIDPQRLFSGVERADVEHTLREMNAGAPYRLHIAVFRSGQETPLELAVGALVRSVARPGEYSVMIMYGVGDTPQIEFGAHELKISDAQRHEWLERMRRAANQRGGGVEGLAAAMHELRACLAPVVQDLPPLAAETAPNVPLIPIQMREEDDAEEVSFKDELRALLEDEGLRPVFITIGVILGVVLLALGFIWLRRRSGHLIKTQPDVRLASPYGAGVSRNVRYLEGREMHKNPRPF